MYQIAVVLTAITHVAFICYVVVGGFIALRWRRTLWLHIAAVLWGAASVVGHVGCPLTGLERWARRHAGMPPLPPKGFIAHYITGVLYPVSWANVVQLAAFAVIVASWALYAWHGRHVPVRAHRGASDRVR
ncbi:hypothetical protein MXEN_11585 [Mycobacterium xenopi RIVM700367]|uniref:DUF2784 domain-containing protein n=1 Tax=Mycobacterium xenopi TaxID=1789 RepID=UPI00025ADB87|nr:DUF2784 domain-containing protein [Mycobacterium xenopi]EID13216.1 hypothetical protein MXEN_11585 [Mycobacterium xenopi RIVM700367]